jgi:Carboxypeptidase regulatory-like domain/TonB dependent receptor
MNIRKSLLLVLTILFSLATLLLGTPSANAQSLQNGAVRGTVYDVSHAVVATATVTLANAATGFSRDQGAGADGFYSFDNVPPGEYTLTANADGFAVVTVTKVIISVGASINVDINMPLKTQTATVSVTADTGAVVDTATAGITQLLNTADLENLPFPGRDFRDLATLSPSVTVVPGLRGGLRLGGQQSDYSGLVVDGGDLTNNFFGENFGSLETKNLTIPLEAVQEFQVVTNGFAPEFGRATGGLLNVVTKSGTNEMHGEAHEYYRGGGLTKDDALGNPSNISNQNQFGGSVGFPIHKDRQFLFLSTDIQRENGPLKTVFCPSGPNNATCEAALAAAGGGPVIEAPLGDSVLAPSCTNVVPGVSLLLPTCYGVATLAGFEGSHNQFQDFFTILGHYDYQFSPANHFSIRGLGTRNHTSGFTGGFGQSETSIAIGNAENFVNQGISGVFAFDTVLGKKVNEIRVTVQGETRKRHPIAEGEPELSITGVGNAGQRFYLPGNNDNGKLVVADNFSYSFGKHDVKFGGDVNSFVDRKDSFAGWSAGEIGYFSLCDFSPNPTTCAGGPVPAASSVDFFEQGFGLNNQPFLPASTLFPAYQTGIGLYWQDKWQITPRLTITYGLRWDGTLNPQPQTPIIGNEVLVGEGSGTHISSVPQRVPKDFTQWGPRLGFAWSVGSAQSPTVIRGAWGLYYAQNPSIFFPTGGSGKVANLFCFSGPSCQPATAPGVSSAGYLFPNALPIAVDGLCDSPEGCPGPTYVDPSFRNPRVSNLTLGLEHTFAHNWTVSVTGLSVHSWDLRTGGFSTTVWARNFQILGTDTFGRSILGGPLDPTLSSNGTNELASFGRGNYNSFVASVNKRFSNRFQGFANYTFSKNNSSGSSERDTDSFFGPQDPVNINLDYGRSQLDLTHQFNSGLVITLPWGFNWSNNFLYHSGLAYPAYIQEDLNGDGVSNQGVGTNDRPTILGSNGKLSLLSEYPTRQPNYFAWDMRISKDINFKERYQVRLSMDIFNVSNRGNLQSDPDNSAFVPFGAGCSLFPGSVTTDLTTCDPLTRAPRPGDATGLGNTFRTLDELPTGATPFAVQFGARFQF